MGHMTGLTVQHRGLHSSIITCDVREVTILGVAGSSGLAASDTSRLALLAQAF
jgi:hypothetical protein